MCDPHVFDDLPRRVSYAFDLLTGQAPREVPDRLGQRHVGLPSNELSLQLLPKHGLIHFNLLSMGTFQRTPSGPFSAQDPR